MTLSRPQTMGAADPRTARKPAPVLERMTFKTSRLAEFCSQRELIAQTGHQVRDWPLVILKELTDTRRRWPSHQAPEKFCLTPKRASGATRVAAARQHARRIGFHDYGRPDSLGICSGKQAGGSR
jgi:hypothetical protein